jgi:hypothetical protein
VGRISQILLKLCALIALTVPVPALACPYCVTQNKDAGLSGVMLLGAMIALPFVIFVAVVPALRRAAAEDVYLLPSDSE